ncbi:hypothetical protein DNL40_08990 [Xylanimonas oleitrophica]|uniref:Small multi-drug export protein n=1 Tax=Xylanimonas oleitrophica TaxID=2607479 RepID=A0A2W5XT66_9MICO|nr:hypothetical protein DNL40_08990 [Xylanimonas oleitrophica]
MSERLGGAELWEQALLLALAGVIPLIESYLGSFLGIAFGVPAWVAVPAAVLGNLVCTIGLVLVTSRVRAAATRGRLRKEKDDTWFRRRVARAAERYGVPGASLLGPLTLPSQVTATVLVALGARRNQVILWQSISIVLWGLAFGLFGEALVGGLAPGA